jgi:bifunctional non-homologous end joining protein LigD
MLPHVAGHFVSLVRAPAGDLSKAFFQRHAFNGMPETIEALPAAGRSKRYLAIDSEAGLLAAVQFGALEFHPWGARRATLAYPDRLVLDLDPAADVPFKNLKSAARLLRDLLAAAEVTSFPLLTGGKGIHVVAPLDETRTWAEVTAFAKAFADRLARAQPGLFVAKAAKSKRQGRIYLDWQRNAETATAIAPFSPRARAGAPVACPVSWEELSRIDGPAAYDLERARRRIAALKCDPWEGYFDLAQTVPDLPP